ncbi:hypothetical protein [Streptomyces sp. NPDC002588]|uniref:caspase, EACC1-associated type n=1 Tax=Streptomyces sp. NPDC002588 TaxID=3154419 RepID=UPI00332ADB00
MPHSMRHTSDFSGESAYAVVVGTGHHRKASALEDLPSVGDTALNVARVLHEVCGMDTSRITLLLDPEDDGVVVEAVEHAASTARGLLLFYFIGHGLLGPQDELYLATHSSQSYERVAHSVPYRSIRNLLSTCPARAVVVLDCCFSGLAEAASRGRRNEALASARPQGSYLLSSASDYALSFAPAGERFTVFSGAVLELLEHGDPAAPAWMTLDYLYAALDRSFEDTAVRPHRLSEDRAGELVIAANRAYRRPLRTPPDSPHPTDDLPCPYPGMEPFQAEDSDRFFGRDDLVADLLGKVCEPPGASPLVLLGPSGVGKSSVLRAGLLAGLERKYEADALTPWPVILLASPGQEPMRAFGERWAQATGRSYAEVEPELAAGRLPGPVAGRPQCQVLVIDQFEEVFTQCQDAAERERFIRLLCADRGAHGPRVVLGMRADHYGNCLSHPALVKALRDRSVIVPPLGEDGVRAAIEQPARAAGLQLEHGLTDLLLRDLREGGHRDLGSALPFLAHALRETWLRRSAGTLTLAGYADTGGIWDSVTETAERIYQELAEPGREVLRDLLLSMVLVRSGSGEAVRRRAGFDELTHGRSVLQSQLVRLVGDRLVHVRLITRDRTGAQISHEALLRAWPRLRQWIAEDRAGLVTRQQLADAADEWQRAGRQQAYCYRGVRLANAEDWTLKEGRRRPLRPLDAEFLKASRAAEDAERTRELTRARRLKQSLGAVVIALVMALVAGGIALQRNAVAQHNRKTAQTRQLEAQTRQLEAAARAEISSDPRAALWLAVAAYHRTGGDGTSRATLLDVLSGTQFSGSAQAGTTGGSPLSYSPDGRTLVMGTGIGTAEIFRAIGSSQVQRVADVAPSPYTEGFGLTWTWVSDHSMMLIAGNGILGRFSLTDRSEPKPRGYQRLVRGLEAAGFSTDGTLLVTAPVGFGPATLWATGHGSGHARSVASFPTRPSSIQTITFSARHHLLALGWQDGIVELWDVADPSAPHRLGQLPGTGDAPQTAAFSADGTRLAVGSQDAQTRLWDLSDPAHPNRVAVLSAHGGPVTSVAFDTAGRYLVTASTDRTAILWDVSARQEPVRAAAFSGQQAQSAAFSPDGGSVVTADPAGQLYFWTITDRLTPQRTGQVAPRTPVKYASQVMPVFPHALHPRGRLLALATGEKQMSLISLNGPQTSHTTATIPVGDWYRLETQEIFSPNGRLLAITEQTGTTTVWNVSDPGNPKQWARVHIDTDEAAVPGLAFSPDGTLMAANVLHHPTTLWNISRRGKPVRMTRIKQAELHGGDPLFIPGGKLLAIGTDLYSVTDPRSPRRLATLPDPDGDYSRLMGNAAAVSPDSRLLLFDSLGRGILLFDISSPSKPRYLSRLPDTEDYGQFAFSPDSRMIAGPGSKNQALLWDVGIPSSPHTLAHVDLDEGLREVAFSADGSSLLTYDTQTVTTWRIAPLSAAVRDPDGRACRLAGSNPIQEQWADVAPDIPFSRVCTNLPSAPATPTGLPLELLPSAIPAGR